MSRVVIMLGSYCGEINYEYLESLFKNRATVSNSEYEKTLMKGFKKNDVETFMIAAPAVGKYPFTCKKMHLKSMASSNDIIPCKYNTFFIGSNISRFFAMKKEFCCLIKKIKNKEVVVIACEAHVSYLKLLKYAKQKYSLRTSLIVPDLPENLFGSTNKIYMLLKSLQNKGIKKLIEKNVDSFLFFTHSMLSRFNLANKKYIVREGAIESFYSSKQTQNKKNHICTYIGKVNKKNGLSFVCDAAYRLPNYIFRVYGTGEMNEEIKNKKLKNLELYGFVDPRKIDKIISSSDVLLSPRIPEEYTNFSFPSKVLKYLSFCKPVVTFKLPCYPEAFKSILTYPKTVSSDAFINSIQTECEKHFLDKTELVKKVCSYLLAKNVANDYCQILFDGFK